MQFNKTECFGGGFLFGCLLMCIGSMFIMEHEKEKMETICADKCEQSYQSGQNHCSDKMLPLIEKANRLLGEDLSTIREQNAQIEKLVDILKSK